jgi:Ca2+-transporting ATPase
VITEKNKALIIITTAAMIMLLCTITVPALQKLFNFQFPGFSHFIISILGAGIMLLILELLKKRQLPNART